MYDIRDMWIPAYFKVLFLGAVLRTTSRSESENHFFSNFTNPHLSLVDFWMRCESALELQWYVVTPQIPLRFETLIPIKSWDETDRIFPKTGHFPRLRPYKLNLQMKITADSPTTQRPHAGVHNSTGQTPGVLIPSHKKINAQTYKYRFTDNYPHIDGWLIWPYRATRSICNMRTYLPNLHMPE